MPLNVSQILTLKTTLRLYVDFLLEKKLSHWLPQLIAPVTLTEHAMIAYLKTQPTLITDALEDIKTPWEIRNHLITLKDYLTAPVNLRANTLPANIQEAIKALHAYPNYNPYYLVAIQQFEADVSDLDETFRKALIAMRELYLEMTPRTQYSYGQNYRTFSFRLGQVPLNLENFGPTPTQGEILEHVEDYIQERLELYQAEQERFNELQNHLHRLHLENADIHYAYQLQQQEIEAQLSYKTPLSQHSVVRTRFVDAVSTNHSSLTSSSELSAEKYYEIGKKHLEKIGEIVEAVECFRKAAEQGHAGAQYNLGVLYNLGLGVVQDYAEAAKWYRKAAEQGHGDAQYNLGSLYDLGQGVVQDNAEAASWLRKAAEQGHVTAQYCLGLMYRSGEGVVQDYTEAAKWIRKAAEQGYVNAQYCLGLMYRSGEGVVQDYTEAAKWYRKAAEQGDVDAQYNLGCSYNDGQGIIQDYAEAAKWFRKAAEQGDTYGCYNLGVLHQKGRGVVQDYTIAIKCYETVLEQEKNDMIIIGKTQYKLARCYHKGFGVDKDLEKARNFYQKAAGNGNRKAQATLGIFYMTGKKGVPQSTHQAMFWFNKITGTSTQSITQDQSDDNSATSSSSFRI